MIKKNINLKAFKRPDEWNSFCEYIIKTNRYVLDKHWKKFIDVILFSAAKRETILKEGNILVRARIGSHYEEKEDPEGELRIDYGPLHCKDMVAPPSDKARDGRINPRGISYLYLSNDIETAILEVRSWIGQDVSVGYFEILSNLKCIDTSKDKEGHYICLGKKQPALTSEVIEKYVWSRINESFSRPISTEDEHTNYIPTQYLSECFKTAGYDGIIYKSALTEKGHNVVLFKPENAQLKGARVFQIESIKPIYKECGNHYSCKRK
jgi:RES domain-containing protein